MPHACSVFVAQGLDIGPDSTETIKKVLSNAKTILWNGPMGVFEMEKFATGTNAVAELLAKLTDAGATTIIGGGDSVAAVEKAGLANRMSHISTGGGASLELLEGKVLPGAQQFYKKNGSLLICGSSQLCSDSRVLALRCRCGCTGRCVSLRGAGTSAPCQAAVAWRSACRGRLTEGETSKEQK